MILEGKESSFRVQGKRNALYTQAGKTSLLIFWSVNNSYSLFDKVYYEKLKSLQSLMSFFKKSSNKDSIQSNIVLHFLNGDTLFV